MNEKKFAPKWLEKLKKIKHIEVYIAIIFILVLLIINFSGTKTKVTKDNSNKSNLSVTGYIQDMENNLEEILSNISGVDNVKVMITLDMGNIGVTNSMLDLNSFPPIKGVIVTAKGVDDHQTKLKVLQAVEAVIEITNGNVQILSSD